MLFSTTSSNQSIFQPPEVCPQGVVARLPTNILTSVSFETTQWGKNSLEEEMTQRLCFSSPLQHWKTQEEGTRMNWTSQFTLKKVRDNRIPKAEPQYWPPQLPDGSSRGSTGEMTNPRPGVVWSPEARLMVTSGPDWEICSPQILLFCDPVPGRTILPPIPRSLYVPWLYMLGPSPIYYKPIKNPVPEFSLLYWKTEFLHALPMSVEGRGC